MVSTSAQGELGDCCRTTIATAEQRPRPKAGLLNAGEGDERNEAILVTAGVLPASWIGTT